MSRCSCGYATKCQDEFCNHIAESWDDLRANHVIQQSH